MPPEPEPRARGLAGVGIAGDWALELIEGTDEGEEPWSLEVLGPAVPGAPLVRLELPLRGPEMVPVLIDCIERTRGVPDVRDIPITSEGQWRPVWVELSLGRPDGPHVGLVKGGQYDDRYELTVRMRGASLSVTLDGSVLDEFLLACRDLRSDLDGVLESLPPARCRWSGEVWTTAQPDELDRETWGIGPARRAFRLDDGTSA